MFFQISPVIHKKNKPVGQKKIEDEESTVEILSLAPFTPNPKIEFDDVVIGTTQTRKLLIKNPTGHDVNLFIKNTIPEEINLVLSWSEAKIEHDKEELLELVWSPIAETACRHRLTLSDGKKINRDVAVTCRSSAPKRLKAGTKGDSKRTKSPIKLSLSRKPISPTKKLKQQRKSVIQLSTTKKKSPLKHCSISQKTPKQQLLRNVTKEYSIIKEEPSDFYQNNSFSNNIIVPNKLSSTQNKENISPSYQQLMCNASASFTSPSNATFLMDVKNEDGRDTFVLNPKSERRETYTLQVDPRRIFSESKNSFIEAAETFTIGVENSPNFSDSLESPSRPLVLREQNNQCDSTPSLESMLDNRNTRVTHERSPNFHYKLKILENFAFSPNVSPYTNTTPKVFLPGVCSTNLKPLSQNNSSEFSGVAAELFPQTNSSFQLNRSNETFTKINTSSNTYTKDNSSFETYIVGNTSTGTYVRDCLTGDLESLEVSPLSRRPNQISSPVFFKQNPSQLSENNKNVAEPGRARNLSSIAEESCVFSESSLRIGSKRKTSDLNRFPSKREKISPKPIQNWSKKGGAAYRIAKSTTGLNIQRSITKSNTLPLLTVKETNTKSVIIQNPFLYAHIIDPFMTSQIYCNDEWIDQQEIHFKKFLNALLTPPKEFITKTDVDVASLWQECRKREVAEAPTKEALSLDFHTTTKLDYLRKQAQNFFRSKEISDVLRKVCLVVETGKLTIRDDKDLHLNLKLKSDIVNLIMSYNPLWLRIGLETIYNEIIPLKSISDTQGLANFILERFLKDPFLIKKYKTPYSPKYSSDLKKFLLKKFLNLIYFLDKAKNAKLIQHDPCLFCKNATEKESKLVLTRFARETLYAVGDITKYLKCLGYVVTHVQSYIHEFDYAVKNLGVDLRDGVRLTRVMEIILMRTDLTSKLRVPAISRLQKVHNMQLVFTSLEESGYKIQYDICAKDIVDGHKEKTLSFLWQIIYKFEAPLMVTNATTIQTWFRSLPIMLKRRKLRKIYERRNNAAKKIQEWYKRQKLSTSYLVLAELLLTFIKERKQDLAAIKIQSFFRMVVCRKRYLIQSNTIRKLQSYAKGWLIRHNYTRRMIAAKVIQSKWRGYLCRKKMTKLRSAVILIQRKFRAKLTMTEKKLAYDTLKMAAVNIQRRYRANVAMRKCRRYFIALKVAVIKIQSFYRMYTERKQFLRLLSYTKIIQTKFRVQVIMKKEFFNYSRLRNLTLFIQQRFRANIKMKKCRKQFLKFKFAAVRIQSFYRGYKCRQRFLEIQKATRILQIRYRAQVAMKKQICNYAELRNATLLIQRRFRANLKMNKIRIEFLKQKNAAVRIQSFYRRYKCRKIFLEVQKATMFLQERYRAQIAMKKEVSNYLTLRNSTLVIQQRFRANLKMKESRKEFLKQKNAAVRIQSFYRRYKCRKIFLEVQKATMFLQERYRAQVAMKKEVSNYLTLRNSTLVIQQRFRANLKMKESRKEFLKQKIAAVRIQSFYRRYKCRKIFLEVQKATMFLQERYRAQVAMKKEVSNYLTLRNSTLVIQQRFRANLKMKESRKEFLKQKIAAVRIQSFYRRYKCRKIFLEVQKATMFLQERYRAQVAMKKEVSNYLTLRNSTLVIQQRFRANLKMKESRKEFLKQKIAAVRIQSFYRRYKCRQRFLEVQKATRILQIRYRAQVAMKKQISNYAVLRNATVLIQQRLRATLKMKENREEFHKVKNAAVRIQSFYRMYKCRQRFLEIQKATRILQIRYRAQVAMKKHISNYAVLKNATLLIQQRFRATLKMKENREEFHKVKNAAARIQSFYKMYKCRQRFLEIQKATRILQIRYRAQVAMKKQISNYAVLRNATLLIQQRFRANLKMKKNKEEFHKLKNAAVRIQSVYRGYECRKRFLQTLNATKVFQERYRAQKAMQKTYFEYQTLKKSVLFVQRKFRANNLAKRERAQYLDLKISVVIVQQRFRAQMAMKEKVAQYVRIRELIVMVQRRYRATVLMRKVKAEFAILKRSTIQIQSKYRARKAMMEQNSYYKRLKKSVILIQQKFRSKQLAKIQRANYLKLRNAAVVIQKRYRAKMSMRSDVNEYSRIKWAALVIQHRYRAQKAMREEMLKYRELRHATFVIQRKFRAKILSTNMRRWFLKFKRSLRIIQKHYRAYLLMKKARAIFLEKYEAAVQLQRLSRGYLVRKKYSPLLTPEAIEARKVLKMQVIAAVKIQSTWRGYSVRTANNQVIVALRNVRKQQLSESKSSVPPRTLAQRCEMAMLCMTNENSSLLMVIRALEDLDFITRHCRTSCIRLSLILPNQLYIIISSAARSLPEMSACNMAAFILINFCKYPQTRSNSWNPEYVDAVINVMLHWCDKEAPLFSTLCTLLWLFCHENEWKKIILNLHNIKQRFHKIHALVDRKQNMVGKSKKICCSSVFGPIVNMTLPTRDANWGLDYNRPNTFTNATFAITSLISILNI